MDFPWTPVISGLSVLATATIAVVAITTQSREAARNRQHASGLAREERVQARRAVAYTDALRFLHASMALVETILPIYKEGEPEPPPELPTEEIWQVQAGLEAFGSDEVQALLDEWGALRREFQLRAMTLADIQAEKGRLPSEIKETWGYLPSEQWRRVEEARRELRAKVGEIARAINIELRGG